MNDTATPPGRGHGRKDPKDREWYFPIGFLRETNGSRPNSDLAWVLSGEKKVKNGNNYLPLITAFV